MAMLNRKNLMYLGISLIALGIVAPAMGYALPSPMAIYSPTSASISLSNAAAMYKNQQTTITATLTKAGGMWDDSLGAQLVYLYIDGNLVSQGVTSVQTHSATLYWTPSAAGSHEYNVTWLGNANFPDGAWVSGSFGVTDSDTPPPDNDTSSYYQYFNWLTIAGIGLVIASRIIAKS